MRTLSRLALVSLLVAAGPSMFAQKAGKKVSGKRHPNLAAAQRFCSQAVDKINAAQQANEFDMQGHAQKAKELLEQASAELKQAAEAANEAKK